MDLTTNKNNEVIVRSTIDLAHNLGYQVIAEGVETTEALNLLKKLSCDCAQGYFFTPPLPAEKFEFWLQDNGWEILSNADSLTHFHNNMSATKRDLN
ncbi:diguanylate cyclase/phosphodiesterase (GGDEF & EAL domains) with PAS/PAC sensor(s) [hydrothermal vent metagenome]|uniref:Diguanylate cyclase/phosphodiesterase (GGDEF & EAL domains) with PAS/PAC sensor(S) n=1 Tax=hydrothermal vent metagenome TaxID=652676 RepID=A0A3B1B077_9ZZZZ